MTTSSLWSSSEAEDDFCVDEFLSSPLVYWAKSLSARDGQDMVPTDLCGNDFLKDILHEIEPQLFSYDGRHQDDPVLQRMAILESVVFGLRTYFTDILGHLLVMRPPDILLISQFPTADRGVKEIRKLLLLLLSFAVQCGQKEKIIERIQNMDENAQKGIVECIKEVTDNPHRVWKMDFLELSDHAEEAECNRTALLLSAHQHIKNLVDDRDELIKLVLLLWRENHQRKLSVASGDAGKKFSPGGNHHAAVDIADLKGQIRRLTQDLYECEEELKECNEELRKAGLSVDTLQNENAELSKDARLVKVYRDELDLLYEKEKKNEKLHAEVTRYRNQLSDMEYLKNRIQEMQENWQLLTDTKVLLESQLESARKRAELVPVFENEVSQVRLQYTNVVMESNNQREQMKDLLTENARLTLELQRYRAENGSGVEEMSNGSDGSSGIGLSLSDQLTESLSTKVLRLETENEKLRTMLEAKPFSSLRSSEYTDSDRGSGASDGDDLFHARSLHDTVDSSAHFPETTAPSATLSDFHADRPAAVSRHLFSSPSDEPVSQRQSGKNELYLEEENFQLKSEVAALRKTVEQLSKSEKRLQECREEQTHTRQSLDDALSEVLNLTSEIRQLEESRAELLEKLDDIEALRKENMLLSSDLKSHDQTLKTAERENKRLRHSLESRSAEFSQLQTQAAELESACKTASQQSDMVVTLQTRLGDLERSNAELTQKLAIASDSLTNLQNELVKEKLHTRNSGKFLKEVCIFLSNQQVNFPVDVDVSEGKTEYFVDALSKAFDQREKNALERSHTEVETEVKTLKAENEALRRSYEQEVRRLRGTPSSISIEASCNSDGRENLVLEKLRTETGTLKQSLSAAKLSLQNTDKQLVNLQSAHQTLQADYKKLEYHNDQMDVELKSLEAANGSLLKSLIDREKEKENLMKNAEESQGAHASLMQDHEALQHLHENLSLDYEKMARDFSHLKSENRKLSHSLATGKIKTFPATVDNSRALRLPDSGDVREERLKRLESEYEKIVSENEALRVSNRQLGDTYRVLTQEHKTVKTEMNQLKLKKIEYEGVVYDCRSQVQSKEIEANKHTEILLGVIASLEDEKRSFAAAIERLVLQYDDVFLHSWREKNQMQTEQKEMQEKLHALDLQKQLLIQKLYDTFKSADSRKRHVSFLKRFRRAAGELVGRSRSRSRTRTISPTDSTADSSSVESSTGGVEFNSLGNRPQSLSMHSMSSLPKRLPERDGTKSGPQLSYSSDDLRKQSSSASSSCISPSDQPHDETVIYAKPIPKPNRPPRRESVGKADPAFHRVGSRRGVYQPNPNIATVVHHPAAKDSPPTVLEPVPTLQTARKALDFESSKPGAKKCCGSYGGFHDCTMLSYTRLTASTALDNRASPSISAKNGMHNRRLSESNGGSGSSGVSTPEGTVKPRHATNPAVMHSRSTPDGYNERPRTDSRLAASDSIQSGYVLRPRSSVTGSNSTISEIEPRTGDSDTVSNCSFPSSRGSVSAAQNGTRPATSYFKSDEIYARIPMDLTRNGHGSISGDGQDSPVWYEYGCV